MTVSEFVSRAEFVAVVNEWTKSLDKFKADVSHQLAHLVDEDWDCGDKACPYNLSGEPDFEEDAGLSGGD